MISTKPSNIGKILLAGATFFPSVSSRGAEEQLTTQPPQSPELDNLLPNSLTLPPRFDTPEIPERVLQKARELAIDPTTIKLEDKMWVECTAGGCTPLLPATKEEIQAIQKPTPIKGLRTGDTLAITGHRYTLHKVEAEKNYGIPGLGTFTTEGDGTKTFTPSPGFEGTVVRSSGKVQESQRAISTPAGTNPSRAVAYSPEKLREVQEEIQSQLDTTFVLIISVPKLCPPCRSYKATVANAAKVDYGDRKVSFVTLNFDSFEEARRKMGTVKVFPTTVVYKAVEQSVQSEQTTAENPDKQLFLPSITRPSSTYSGALTQSSLDTVIKRALK